LNQLNQRTVFDLNEVNVTLKSKQMAAETARCCLGMVELLEWQAGKEEEKG
jgi:hypothetical protein